MFTELDLVISQNKLNFRSTYVLNWFIILKGQQTFVPGHLHMCNKVLFLKYCRHRVQEGAAKFDLAF